MFGEVVLMRAFVGRDRELNILRRSLERMFQSQGSLVLVSGEAGIGKTSLVHELISEARERGAMVLTGQCYDLSATPPYGPWLELFERYHPHDDMPDLPRVLRTGTGVGELSSQAELFQVAIDFVITVSEMLPLVLVLEDLHWSDQASLEGLRHIARQIDEQRVLIIATYRDDEIAHRHPLFRLLPAIVRESRTERLDLRPLNGHAITQLVESEFELSSVDHDALIEYLIELSDGNPLFADELLRTLEREGIVRQGRSGWHLADLSAAPIPSLIQQLIERRMESLDERSRSAIRVAAVIGQKVPLGIWELLADAALLGEAVQEAMDAGLIREASEVPGITFRHALVRDAIYATVPLHERRALHGRLAELLLNRSRYDLESISFHLKQAGDERAAEWLIRAGEQAERTFAWHEAFVRYNEALDVLYEIPASEPTAAGLMLKTARLLRFLDPGRATDYLNTARRMALDCGEQTIAAAAQFNIGTNLCNLGDFRRGLQEMTDAVEILSASPEESARIARWTQTSLAAKADPIEAWLGLLTMNLSTAGRFHEAIEMGQRSLRVNWDDVHKPEVVAQLSEHTHSSLDALEGIGVAMAALGKPDDARIAFDLSQEIHRKLNYGPPRVIVSSLDLIMNHFPYRANHLHERARLVQIIEDHVQVSSEMVGDQNSMWGYEHYLVYSGRWNELRELIDSGLTPTLVEYRCASKAARARLHWYQGHHEEAWEALSEILKDGPRSNPREHVFIVPAEPLLIAAGLALDAGNVGLAREWMTTHDAWLEWSGAVLGIADGLLLWAKIHHAEGNLEEADRLAREAIDSAGRPVQPIAQIAIYRFLGDVCRQRGELDTAETHLRTSLKLAEACDLPYERALTLLGRAGLEIAKGNRREAVDLLGEVRRVGAELGARPLLDRAERLTPMLSPPRTSEALYGLSARELEVLRLLVEGLSNKEIGDRLFISHRTAMQHVSSILRKLDVENRSAVAARAVRENLV
jgi:DNA-binding CsgD family transcriptional regulator